MKNDITISNNSLRIYTGGILRFDMPLKVICRTRKRLLACLQVLASKSWWHVSMAEQIWRMVRVFVQQK